MANAPTVTSLKSTASSSRYHRIRRQPLCRCLLSPEEYLQEHRSMAHMGSRCLRHLRLAPRRATTSTRNLITHPRCTPQRAVTLRTTIRTPAAGDHDPLRRNTARGRPRPTSRSMTTLADDPPSRSRAMEPRQRVTISINKVPTIETGLPPLVKAALAARCLLKHQTLRARCRSCSKDKPNHLSRSRLRAIKTQ